jgi:glycosyltransferase involved in cell wall biosynthesis
MGSTGAVKKKKIAFVFNKLGMGGTEKALVIWLRNLDYSRYDVTLWLNDSSGELFSQIDQRVNIRFWGELFKREYAPLLKRELLCGRLFSCFLSVFYRFLAKIHRDDDFLNLSYFLRSYRVMETESYDTVINVGVWHLLQMIVALFYLKSRKKVLWSHSLWIQNRIEGYGTEVRSLINRFDRFIFCSEAAKKTFLADLPEYAERSSVVYNIIDYTEVMEKAREPVPESFDRQTIVTVARLSSEKGVLLIPPAARILADQGYRFQWLLIGDGKKREELEEQIRELGLSEVVILTGTKINPYPYIKNCSVYVQPSYSESFSLSVVEAIILERPVISAKVPALTELYDEDEYALCDTTPASIAEEIRKVLDGEIVIQHRKRDYEDHNRRQLQKLYACI